MFSFMTKVVWVAFDYMKQTHSQEKKIIGYIDNNGL